MLIPGSSYEVIEYFKVKDIVNQRIRIKVPLNYRDSSRHETIDVVGVLTQRYNRKLHSDQEKLSYTLILPEECEVIAYIQGGPGFPCSPPARLEGLTKALLDRRYSVFWMDQRGTGWSTQLDASTLELLVKKCVDESDEEYTERQLEYLLNFRADSIVEDLERFRKAIVGDRKWSILGQSYGGFCCFTYLSSHKDSLKQVFITGGIPPIGFHADDVYKATYQRCKERNIHYYDKYPTDIKKVRRILQFLNEHTINLPNSGKLTVERFQQLGIILGSQGGTDRLHEIVSKFDHDLNVWEAPTYSVLHDIQNESSFDTNIIYALFQEAIYCDGTMKEIKTNWSADRIRYLPGNENFIFGKSLNQSDPVFFTGEMVFRSMYADYSELSRLKPLAEALHTNTNWSVLYNIDVLKRIDWNDVQIVAATYYYDQYVDFNTSMAVKNRLFPRNSNLRQYITSEFFHGGLRTNPDKVLSSLFDLLQEEVD